MVHEMTPLSSTRTPGSSTGLLRVPCYEGSEEHEPNNGVWEANGPLRSGREYSGRANDDNDYFSVYLETAGWISVTLNHPLAHLEVYDNNLVRKCHADRPPHDYRCEYSPAESGWYYVRVFTPRHIQDPETVYLLTVAYAPESCDTVTPPPTQTATRTWTPVATSTPTRIPTAEPVFLPLVIKNLRGPTPTPTASATATPTPTPTCPPPLVSTRPHLTPTTLPGEVRISDPKNCATGLPAGVPIPVSGTCRDIPDDLDIWVLVYAPNGKYYPQLDEDPECDGEPSAKCSGGRWGVTIYLGDPEHGGQFDIVCLLADQIASQFFMNKMIEWCPGPYPGLWPYELPTGIMEKDSITVSATPGSAALGGPSPRGLSPRDRR
ncbi:MAG: hypothetical protein FJZ90_00655 [Chloroflexi bacterium]|nr:hypothetical protein [Chloroflexota bacterium]